MRTASLALVIFLAAGRNSSADPCVIQPGPRTVHKALVTPPQAVSADEALRAKAVAALKKSGVKEVIADYDGEGGELDGALLVTADEKQLMGVLTAGYKVALANQLDLATFPTVVIDVAGRGKLEAPLRVPGWELDAKPTTKVPYVVQLRGRPSAGEAADTLAEMLLEMGPELNTNDSSVEMKLTEEQAKKLSALPTVQWVGRVEPLYKVHPSLIGGTCDAVPYAKLTTLRTAVGNPSTDSQDVVLAMTLFEDAMSDRLEALLKAVGGAVVENAISDAIVIKVQRRAIRVLANQVEVRKLELHREPVDEPVEE